MRVIVSQGICSTSIIVLAHLNLILGAMGTENRVSTIRFHHSARPSRPTFTTISTRWTDTESGPETDITGEPPEFLDRDGKAHELEPQAMSRVGTYAVSPHVFEKSGEDLSTIEISQ